MKSLSFADLPTECYRLPIAFEVYDPKTEVGRRAIIPVDIEIPCDRHGASPEDGSYADTGRHRNRHLVYWRVEDVEFAPFWDATLNGCSRLVYETNDVQTKLAAMSFQGQHALPLRFDDVMRLDGSTHSVTGKRIEGRWSLQTESFAGLRNSGLEVIGYDERVAAVRETAARCFLVRQGVGLCMAAEQPIWGTIDNSGHPYVHLYLVSPGRGRLDVFNLTRKDEAITYARTFGAHEPELSGRIVRMPAEVSDRDDAALVLAGEHSRIARALRDNVLLLDRDALSFWHDCVRGAAAVRGYGTPAQMIELLDGITASLAQRPDEAAKWKAEIRGVRKRLDFESGLEPVPRKAPAP